MLNDWYLAADAEIALNAGDPELALSRARVVLDGPAADVLVFSSGVAERVLGEVAALRGERDEADAHMQRSLQLHARGGIHVQIARTEFRWALQHMRRGDEQRGRELFAGACQKFESFPCRYALAQCQRQFHELTATSK
jgi:ATP/maltotriose-dependent transcriptional regulator MalT